MTSFDIILFTCCFYIVTGPLARITAETYSLTSRLVPKELMHTLQFRQISNLPASVDPSEDVQQQAAVKNVQYFSIAESQLQANRFSKRDTYNLNINAPLDEEDFDDMELAEINVFRPLFQYRLAYAKQVKNAQRRQFG